MNKLLILSFSASLLLLQSDPCSSENVVVKCPPTEFIVGINSEYTIWWERFNVLKGVGLIHFMFACSPNKHRWYYKINQTDPSREHRFNNPKTQFTYAQLCKTGKIAGIASSIQNVYHRPVGHIPNVNAVLIKCCEDSEPGSDFKINLIGRRTQVRQTEQKCPPMQGVCGLNMDIRGSNTDGSNYGFRNFEPICCPLNWK